MLLNLGLGGLIVAACVLERPKVRDRAGDAIGPAALLGRTSMAEEPRAPQIQSHQATKAKSLSWKQFSTDDYPKYISQLRSVGCPFSAICDIIVGALSRQYDPRLSALRRSSGTFWTPAQRPTSAEVEVRRKQMEQAAALELERDELIRDLLGIEFKDYLSRSSGRGDRWDEILSFMPDSERRRQVRPVLAKYEDLENGVIRASGGTLGADDSAALKRLYAEKLEELGGAFTPSELEEYQLRTSPIADALRNNVLIGFRPTEEEFRAIFRAYHTFDPSISGSPASEDEHARSLLGIATRDEQIRQALGDQRFADYVRSQDQTYLRLVELTDYFGLPTDAAIQVHNVREDVLAKVREINQQPALPEHQRLATLQEIKKQTEVEVVAKLGEEAFRQYSRAPWGVWIQEILR